MSAGQAAGRCVELGRDVRGNAGRGEGIWAGCKLSCPRPTGHRMPIHPDMGREAGLAAHLWVLEAEGQQLAAHRTEQEEDGQVVEAAPAAQGGAHTHEHT